MAWRCRSCSSRPLWPPGWSGEADPPHGPGRCSPHAMPAPPLGIRPTIAELCPFCFAPIPGSVHMNYNNTGPSDNNTGPKNIQAWTTIILARIIIIIIIIAFKGAIQDFFFLQSLHSAANHLQHVRSSGPGAIVCKSRATHRALITCKCHVTCQVVRRDSSAIKLDRVEIAFIWALFYWLNHYTNGGGEKTGVPGENPWWWASENAT